MHCTYNVTLWRHLVPIITVETQQGIMFFFSFPHYLINNTIFRGKLLNIKCVFWFFSTTLSETLLIRRRIEGNIISLHKYSCKVPFILVSSYCTGTWCFLDRFSKNFWNIKFHGNLSSCGGELFHADGQTGMTKLDSRFSQFFKSHCNEPGVSQ